MLFFSLKVGWKGAYNTSGTADINYVCKIVGDQLQFRNLEIVSSDNPTVEEYCKVVAATHDAEVISDPNCDIRRRVERKHSVSVNKAYTSELRVKTTGNTNDCGINGSNITAVSVTYHMDWDGGYSEISYFYNVKNGKWEHVNSGITKTSDTTPGIIDEELVDTIIRNLPIIIEIVMRLSQG